MDVLASLKPKNNPQVMKLVAQAGVDVSRWALGKNGPVKTPSSNPAFCYAWSFIEPSKTVVLNVWHDELRLDGDRLRCVLSPRNHAEDLAQASHLRPGQRTSGRRRSRALEDAVAYAWENKLPVRLIIGDGQRRNLTNRAEQTASTMRLRLLDPEPWTVTSYSSATGCCQLDRGCRTDFVDQFSWGEGQVPSRKVVTGQIWDRSAEVRRSVLLRAGGFCEFCGEPGFKTITGMIYLESHHIIALSEGGPDTVGNVAALCPNDHRQAHFGQQREITRRFLLAKIKDC